MLLNSKIYPRTAVKSGGGWKEKGKGRLEGMREKKTGLDLT